MPTPKLLYHVAAEYIPDTGRDPVDEIDTDTEINPLILTGFKECRKANMQIPSLAVDTAFTFTDAVALLIFSDVPIHVRLVAAQTQVQNVRFFGWCADKETLTVKTTSVLISVPGVLPANLRILYVEKA